MLPQKHFDALEKEAMDMLNSSTDSSDTKVKKVVDIKENAIDKTSKTLSDDDAYDDDYEYTNDDGDSDTDEVISITPKPVSAIKCKHTIYHKYLD